MSDAITKALKMKGLVSRFEKLATQTRQESSSTNQERLSDLPLFDFIPLCTPRIGGTKTVSPTHLSAIVDSLERIEIEPVRQLISTPPQHGKTETILHGLVWLLDRNPELRIAYVSYSQAFSDKQAGSLRRYATAAGLSVDKATDARRFWRTKQGGFVVATSIGGELTGLGIDVLVVDDPYKDRNVADSSLMRDKVYDWFTSAALTRMSPNGSVVVVHTRWHQDDLIGRLTEANDWDYIKLQAINDQGDALWPEVRGLKWLNKQRESIGAYDWSALYQGDPRARGDELFRTPVRYEHPDLADSRIIIAVDPAATSKTYSDYSAAVVLAVKGYEDGMRADVLDVLRKQCEIAALCDELETLQKKYQAPLYIESIGVGKAVPVMLRALKPALDIKEIVYNRGDKFTRAQPASAAWNLGRVRVPLAAPWLNDFLTEMTSFTGVNDTHDDQVDALSLAWNTAAQAVVAGTSYSPLHEGEVDLRAEALSKYIRDKYGAM